MGALFARLTRFYGGDPWRWVAVIPMALVRAYEEMMPRLEAEESLLALTRTALGTGSAKKDHADAVLDAWRREIAPDAPPTRVYPTADELRAKGLKVFGPKAVPA